MEQVSNQVAVLERIANALEGILQAMRKSQADSTETPFPWGEVSTRLRNAEANSREPGAAKTTCEGLIHIGRSTFANPNSRVRRWRFAGTATVREIDPIMKRLGFGKQWMAS